MTALIPSPVLQFSDGNGKPFAGGAIYAYEPGTFTPVSTFLNAAGTVPNPNPVVLDSDGRASLYARGRVRLILHDAANNLIWDGETEAPLGDSVISAVMLPVVGAPTLAEARRLMGIDDAIQVAVANIGLMPGPQGAPGPTGAQGPQGVPGPQGTPADTDNQMVRGNPGYLYMPDTGYLHQFGRADTAANGIAAVAFARPFATCLSVTAVTADNSINLVLRVGGINNAGFTVGIEDTNNTRGWPCNFCWQAVGFA